MDSLSPLHFFPDEKIRKDVNIYHIHSPFHPLPSPPAFSFSNDVGCPTQTQSTSPVSRPPPSTPKAKFVSYEMEMRRSPAMTTCPCCQTLVTTLVVYSVGSYALLMCLVFALCGLLLGCCLIPLFVNYFKDALHICPCCRRILHVHRRKCCE